MAKNRQTKIDKLEAQIAEQREQLKLEKQNQAKEQRKAKINRQISRQKLLESVLPDTINLTDEQYMAFITKHVTNEHGRKALANIIAQTADKPAENHKNTTTHTKPNTPQTPKSEMQAPAAATS